MFLDQFKEENCCGCSACSHICNVGAITMKRNAHGFAYPLVNKELCKDCGRCETVCPMQENYVGQEADPEIYAFRNHDADVVHNSSSGGTFSALAEWIFEQKGVVYGCAFDEKFMPYHTRAESMEQAIRFRTSKYVESTLKEVFGALVQDLKSGKTVLFTGTPCQVSAVKKYLKARNVSTELLYTCDNICHGVPSRRIWKDYLHIIQKKYLKAGERITCINMRSKDTAWQKQDIRILTESGNLDTVTKSFSFNRFFLSLFSNRPSCFHCRYTSYKRVADFSLGDFWNVEQAGISFPTDGGVNEILVNSEKGKELFAIIKERGDWEAVSKKAAWQPHLEYSAKAPNQKKFWDAYQNARDKEKTIRKFMKGSLLTRVIRMVSPALRKTGLYEFAGKMYKILIVGKKSKHE